MTLSDIEQQIRQDIDEWCKQKYNEGHREHLGASIMGESCSRKLWYSFRWIKKEIHEGRIQRLFQVGHKAEPRFIEYLRGIGFQVWDRDENGKQFRIVGIDDHYGGSLDAVAVAPAHYGLPTNELILCEFKTNGTGAAFTNVDKDGLEKAKPRHWAQVNQYGFLKNIRYCLYLIENKNDSDIIVKLVKLNWEYGKYLINKADEIIHTQVPPAKISENQSYFECKYCNFKNICHENTKVDINCRSCKFSKPVEKAEWKCTRYNSIIPKDFIKIGCNEHVSINW